MESKLQCFDGSGDIKAFLEKVKLQSVLKGYEDKKAAHSGVEQGGLRGA